MSFIAPTQNPLLLPDCGIRSQFLPHIIAEHAQARIKFFLETGYEKDSTNIKTMIGPSGSGKSQIIKDLMRQKMFRPHWRFGDTIVYMDSEGPKYEGVTISGTPGAGQVDFVERPATPEEIALCQANGVVVRPIAYAEIPSDTSRKGILQKILKGLGIDVKTKSASVSDLMAQAHLQLKKQKCRLLVLDEAQQIATESRVYEYAEFIRQFVNEGTVPLLLVGLPDAIKLTQDNDQVARRSKTCLPYGALDWKVPIEKQAFDEILGNYEATLQKANRPFPVTHEKYAKAFYRVSGGLISRSSQFLGAALDIAYLTPSKLLTNDIFKQAYREFRFLYASMHAVPCPFTYVIEDEKELVPAAFDTGAKAPPEKPKRARAKKPTP